MNMKYFLGISILFTSFFLFQKEKPTLYIIVYSTVRNSNRPQCGWGEMINEFLDTTQISISNQAMAGRSTRTFISENRWQPIADSLHEGDYVLMQFGHNDESVDKKERYSTPDTFKMNLTKFITETRAKKATPILLTPVSRRKFDKDGIAIETHAAYSVLVREVAKEQQALFIDLDEKSRALYQQFGEENSKLLFLQLQPGEHPN